MAERRKVWKSVCVWYGAKLTLKFEMFPSEQWPDGARGRYRVRLDRRWLDAADGGRLYLDAAGIGALLAERLGGPKLAEEAAPDLRPGQPVRVLNGRTAEGVGPLFDLTRVAGEPIRGFDGRWYVAVVLMGRGLVHVPASDVQTTKERG
ncbi:hypothetical protein [Desulfovibrio aminophilus]|uniref:hypothetical protein n=1 Tax=Desulfovibrio aminophilus TaxID=81425 RepID=UPI000402A6C9|nr:hypothetical protein [Desulfovibrio aminophilus]